MQNNLKNSIDNIQIYQEEYINECIYIDKQEKMILENKIVHIASGIICAVELKFNNCIIYYNEYDIVDSITLAENASLKIIDSVVICKSTNYNMFIKGQENNSVTIKYTIFESCCSFMELKLAKEILVHKCILRNCSNGVFVFQMNDKSRFEMAYSTIIAENVNASKRDESSLFMPFSYYMIEVKSSGHIAYEFHNNKIIEKNSCMKGISHYLYGVGVNVYRCNFRGLSSHILAWNIKDCIFKECNHPVRIGFSLGRFRGLIDSCTFEKCSKVLAINEKTSISNCRFRTCSKFVIDGSYAFTGGILVENCSFIEISNVDNFYRASIVFNRTKDKESCENIIRNCKFDRCRIKYGCLIKASCYENPKGIVAIIEDSYFKRCTTNIKCGKTINEFDTYRGFFNRECSFNAIINRNCKGLDAVKICN